MVTLAPLFFGGVGGILGIDVIRFQLSNIHSIMVALIISDQDTN